MLKVITKDKTLDNFWPLFFNFMKNNGYSLARYYANIEDVVGTKHIEIENERYKKREWYEFWLSPQIPICEYWFNLKNGGNIEIRLLPASQCLKDTIEVGEKLNKEFPNIEIVVLNTGC